MYNLSTRYYDPEVGRFLNADGYVSTGQGMLGYNMFAYCGNNPVNRYDPTGESFLGITIGGVAVWKICVAIIGAIGLYFTADSLVNNPPKIPSLSLPKSTDKSESESKTKDIAPTIPKSTTENHEHHIVAKSDHRAEESRQILEDVGINPKTDPRNLITLPKKYHASLHTTAYHNYVTERLRPVAGDKLGVETTLNSLKMEIRVRSLAGIRWE